MNERILELAESATKRVNYRIDQFTLKQIDDPSGPYIRTEFNQEQFGRMIVEECVRVALKDALPDLGIPVSGANAQCLKIAADLKEHFGVEPSNEQLKIRSQLNQLSHKLEKTHHDIRTLQQLCTHPGLKKMHKADTGNYDPSANRYWIVFECPDCGKKWVEDKTVRFPCQK